MKYIAILAILFFIYLLYENKNLTISTHHLDGPQSLRIVHLSDIHNWQFGKDNCRLVEKITQLHPDVILITGDFIDKRFPKRERCYSLAEKLVKIAPVYYVRGNHEVKLNDYQYIENIQKIGFHYLENQTTTLGQKITLIGLDDCSLASKRSQNLQKDYIRQKLDQLAEKKTFTILLSHQPQHLDVYCQYPIDLVLSGHAHGGQVRFPVGLYAPGQGIFPKYYQGLMQQKGTKEIISRGIGNSLFPLRAFNNPEIILIQIQPANDKDKQ